MRGVGNQRAMSRRIRSQVIGPPLAPSPKRAMPVSGYLGSEAHRQRGSCVGTP